jgi:hypothetical protein
MNRIIESRRQRLRTIRLSLTHVRSGLRKNQDCTRA